MKSEGLKDIPDWPEAQIPDVKLPTEFDWRKLGAVTEVKNQVMRTFKWNFQLFSKATTRKWKLHVICLFT